MSDGQKPENRTVDLVGVDQVSALCEEYAAACQASGITEPAPAIDPYLTRINPAHRETLRVELEKARLAHRSHASLPATPLGGTVEHRPGDSQAESAETGARGTIKAAGSTDTAWPAAAEGDAASQAVVSKTINTSEEAGPGASAVMDAEFSLSDDVEVHDQVQVPGYAIVGELGRGAMGVVYKARQVALNRWVALKMVLAGAHASKALLDRFRAEAKAVAVLQHPNIVQIYEVGELDGLPYFSLEFVDGGVLSEKVHRQPQPPKEAAHLVETLARAMYYAHQNGVIHRDLKPSNVLLTSRGIPKISDFGLAKQLEGDGSQTKSGTILGTPNYMAPEQARGEIHNVGAPADIYSLGAILYELLTGRPPFEAATIMETVMCVTRDEPVTPSRIQEKTPRDVETICLKCLEKDIGKRYTTAEALAEDLRRYLVGDPILARPISAPERLWRWCRRNPRVAGLSATVFLLLVLVTIGSVLSTFWIRQESAAKDVALDLADRNAVDARRQAEKAMRAEKKATENATKARRAEKKATENATKARRAEKKANENAAIARQAEKKATESATIARQAEKKATESAAIASDQRKLAIDSLYVLITKVEDKLRDIEGMSDLRQDILKTAMAGLGNVAKSVETAKIVDRSMGVALQRMGDTYERLGKTEETEKLYLASLKIFDRLEAEGSVSDWIPWNKAVSFDKLGGIRFESHGNAAAGLDYYQKSLALRRALEAKPGPAVPPIPAALRKIAVIVSYHRLASLTRHIGDPARSREYSRRGLKECQALLDVSPNHPAAVYYRAAFYHVLGMVLAHLNAAEEARKTLAQCLEMRQKAVEKNKVNAQAKRELGAAHDALGDLELERQGAKAALEHYGKSVALYEQLHKKEATNAEDRWYLAHGYYRRGVAKDLLGDRPGAEKDFTQAMKLREGLTKTDPKSLQFQAELMLARARLGRHAEASKASGELRKRAPKNPAVLLSAAGGYALAIQGAAAGKAPPPAELGALQRRYADLAFQTLEQALALGFQDRVRLEVDPDLAALRAYPEYKKLLKQLPRR
jgi:serine/threonine-protein kinase